MRSRNRVFRKKEGQIEPPLNPPRRRGGSGSLSRHAGGGWGGGWAIEETLGQQPQRFVHPLLQFVADAYGAGCALGQYLVQPAAPLRRAEGRLLGVGVKGGGAKEEVEVAGGIQFALFDQLNQVNLVEDVQAEAGTTVTELPPPPVGDHPPGTARPPQVVVNLIAGVGVGEGVGRAIHDAFVQGTVPALGIAHGQNGLPELRLAQRGRGSLSGLLVGEEGVVGCAERPGQRRLHLVDVAQDVQHRPNPVLLCLGLVVVG